MKSDVENNKKNLANCISHCFSNQKTFAGRVRVKFTQNEGHEKPQKRHKHDSSRQMRATKSHEEVTSKSVTSNEKSSDFRMWVSKRKPTDIHLQFIESVRIVVSLCSFVHCFEKLCLCLSVKVQRDTRKCSCSPPWSRTGLRRCTLPATLYGGVRDVVRQGPLWGGGVAATPLRDTRNFSASPSTVWRAIGKTDVPSIRAILETNWESQQYSGTALGRLRVYVLQSHRESRWAFILSHSGNQSGEPTVLGDS